MPELRGNSVETAIQLLDLFDQSRRVYVRFTKRTTGENREMVCTLDFDLIPRRDHPRSFSLKRILKWINNNRILHVYDLEKRGWRSIPLDAIHELRIMDVDDDAQNWVRRLIGRPLRINIF